MAGSPASTKPNDGFFKRFAAPVHTEDSDDAHTEVFATTGEDYAENSNDVHSEDSTIINSDAERESSDDVPELPTRPSKRPASTILTPGLAVWPRMSPTPAGPSRVRDSSPHQRAGLRTAVGAEAAAIDGPASRTRSTASTAASTYRATQSALEDASRLAASKKPRKRNKWIKEEEETLKELIKTAVLESDDDVVSMATIKARDQDADDVLYLRDQPAINEKAQQLKQKMIKNGETLEGGWKGVNMTKTQIKKRVK